MLQTSSIIENIGIILTDRNKSVNFNTRITGRHGVANGIVFRVDALVGAST